MIRRRQLTVNAAMSALQVVIVGVSFLVLYRFLRDALGEEGFGVWALVLATTSVGSLANLGFAASAVKFVSQYLARDDRAHLLRIMQTATLSVGLFLGIIVVLIYPLLRLLLGLLVEPADRLPEALLILPYALFSFWLMSVAGVFMSCLDGLHRIDLRAMLMSLGAAAYLVLAFLLVPGRGIVGIAQAQVLQAGLLLAASWLLLRRQMPSLPVLPWRWDRGAFREMLGYSLHFQAISITQLLLEPTVKALVSKFGGVATLANFEFAYRMAFQLRSLIATTHQAIVPTIAEVDEKAPALLRGIYVRSYRVLLFLVMAMLPLLLALVPLISRIWIGRYEPEFAHFAMLVFVGWFINLLANPAYFANMGTGALRWNVLSHLIIGLLSGGLGLVLGARFGGDGVVVAYAVALVAGSVSLATVYERGHGIRPGDLFTPSMLGLSLAAGGGMALSMVLYHRFEGSWNVVSLLLLVVGVYGAATAIPLWRHPVRREVQQWLIGLKRTPTMQSE